MKTKTLSLIGLGLVFALAWPVSQSLGAKGGNPGKPGGGGEKPPPEPPPISYQPAVIEVPEGCTYLDSVTSINDAGVVAGVFNQYYNTPVLYRMTPETIDGEVVYQTDNMMLLCESVDEPFLTGAPQFWINNHNQVAGTYVDRSSGLRHIYYATVWLEDGTPVDLGVTEDENDSRTCAFNDDGLVVVWSVGYESGVAKTCVVVPVDSDADGNPDIWFVDNDADGINDLCYPLPEGDFGIPTAISSSGIVLFEYGVVVIPDMTDADGDGNPWIGGNTSFEFLQSLLDGDWVEAYDINDLGQIVGCSGHPVGGWDHDSRAILWNDISSPFDLGGLSDHSSELVAGHINTAGQIIGECREKKTLTTFLIHDDQMFPFQDLIGLTGSELTGWNVNEYALADINDDGWVVSLLGAVCFPIYPSP